MTARASIRRLAIAIACAAALAPGSAHAVVEQMDGTVVPTQVGGGTCPGVMNSCVQTALNVGEGLAANAPNNPLKAVFDARTSPEIFTIPKKNGVYGALVVDDLQEGAGYESAFGWYNVDDPASLYSITPCTDEPGSSRVVDFQVELTLGHYLGGYIGFFLVTPEGAPGGACASPANIGHAYYTEQARNGDGNYVHYLVYHSKKDPLAYYFGFEDLYRGGDNDFDDMFLKVKGLVAPCEPSPEICNGMDDNCDGLADNAPIDAGGPCGTSDLGECQLGLVTCQAGVLACVGEKGPSSEICNGLDDDCDGTVDDAPADVGVACGVAIGLCSPGTSSCAGGVLLCTGAKGPAFEVCNGLDDDCDGTVDDAPVDAGGPCGSNVGACKPGKLACSGAKLACAGGVGPAPETCNGADDDCNGAIDDGDPEGGGPCGSSEGVCKQGALHCLGGSLVCVGGSPPSVEVCNGLDDDCDGKADDGATCPDGATCVSGACSVKCSKGEFACPGAQICVDGWCLPDPCGDVTCPVGQVCQGGDCVPGHGGAGGSGGAGGHGGGPATGGAGGAGGEGGEGSGGASSPSTTGSTPASAPRRTPIVTPEGGGVGCSTTPNSPIQDAVGIAIAALAIAGGARRRGARRRAKAS